MKITPLNPQFIVSTPEATEEARPSNDSEPRLHVVPPEASASANNPERPLDQQTRGILRRLSRFIHQRKKRNQHAFMVYDRVAHCLEDQDTHGLNLDKKA